MSKRITFTDEQYEILLGVLGQAESIDDATDEWAVEYDKKLKALKEKLGVKL